MVVTYVIEPDPTCVLVIRGVTLFIVPVLPMLELQVLHRVHLLVDRKRQLTMLQGWVVWVIEGQLTSLGLESTFNQLWRGAEITDLPLPDRSQTLTRAPASTPAFLQSYFASDRPVDARGGHYYGFHDAPGRGRHVRWLHSDRRRLMSKTERVRLQVEQ